MALEDLYVLDRYILNSVSIASVNNVSAHVWHNKRGHLSFKRLDNLKHHLQCDVSRLNKVVPCYICPLAKQRRLSFDSHNHMSQIPFDLVLCDVWGLIMFLHMLAINTFSPWWMIVLDLPGFIY